jgi:protein-disulfide isomerase
VKQIIVIIVLVAGIIGAAVLLGGSDEETTGAVSNNFYGKEDSTVVLTEYADFECPACAQFAPVITQVKEIYKDQVKFEFKHFPLVQIHPNSIAAHRAAEASAQQGKFWEMHDLLFAQQQSWAAQNNSAGGFTNNNPAATFEQYASDLGLDIEQYKADVASDKTIGTINADIAAGREKGAESTPTFFLNGTLVEDLNQLATVEGFSAFLDNALGGSSTENSPNTEADSEAIQSEDEVAKPEEDATAE